MDENNISTPNVPASIAGNANAQRMDAHGMMDIGKAKSLYVDCGSVMVREYDSVVKFCRSNRVSAPLANGNFLHALTLTELMFGHTEQSLSMLTGGHGDGFIACLEKTFRAMLIKLRRNNGLARIIVVDGDRENSLLAKMATEFPNNLKIARGISAGKLIPHFIVGDGEMVRDEQPHAPLENESDANLVKADVYFHNPAVAELFTSRFNAFWTRLTQPQV